MTTKQASNLCPMSGKRVPATRFNAFACVVPSGWGCVCEQCGRQVPVRLSRSRTAYLKPPSRGVE